MTSLLSKRTITNQATSTDRMDFQTWASRVLPSHTKLVRTFATIPTSSGIRWASTIRWPLKLRLRRWRTRGGCAMILSLRGHQITAPGKANNSRISSRMMIAFIITCLQLIQDCFSMTTRCHWCNLVSWLSRKRTTWLGARLSGRLTAFQTTPKKWGALKGHILGSRETNRATHSQKSEESWVNKNKWNYRRREIGR